MTEDDPKFDLPAASLQLDAATLDIIERSRVKNFIGPLILKAHEKKAQKIALLSWDSEKLSRVVAQILTVGLSQQLDRRCALVIPEGIRFNCESYESLSIITLPEIEMPTLSERVEAFVTEMDRIYPFQIFVGPPIKDWNLTPSAKHRMALGSDAQILVAPKAGFPRGICKQIETFSTSQRLNWLGCISIDEGEKGKSQ